ncbi:MAG TPA: response regulator transcription factor [Dehalococcoidia bacterium]|nr:response regulator transcription factor [Dehalococcoidia bacterium]
MTEGSSAFGSTVAAVSGASKRRVLLVDDDSRLLVTLGRGLALRGFEVSSAESAGMALPQLEDSKADILVLDVAMPGMDGISFCRLIRDRFQLPILMLTARDDIADRVAGLEAGADDYLVKPFALDELVARIHALLRRFGPPKSKALNFQDLRLDRVQWLAFRGEERLPLTATEFRLLEQLLLSPGAAVSRDALLDAVWIDGSQPETNAIDVHVRNLRRKLEAGGRSRLVHTVRGVGYRLQAG